jgi:hypothetical protein
VIGTHESRLEPAAPHGRSRAACVITHAAPEPDRPRRSRGGAGKTTLLLAISRTVSVCWSMITRR